MLNRKKLLRFDSWPIGLQVLVVVFGITGVLYFGKMKIASEYDGPLPWLTISAVVGLVVAAAIHQRYDHFVLAASGGFNAMVLTFVLLSVPLVGLQKFVVYTIPIQLGSFALYAYTVRKFLR